MCMKKFFHVFFAVAVAFILDQFSKKFIMENVHTKVALFPFLNISPAWNNGICFGIMGSFEYARLIIIVIATLISCILIFLIYRSRDVMEYTALSFITGGALGNITDRIVFGSVYDFIDFHVYHLHGGTFNIADVFIFCGICLILIYNSSKKNNITHHVR